MAVRGVQLDLDLALTQDGARTLARGRAGTPSKDNRNLYLVRHPLLFSCAASSDVPLSRETGWQPGHCKSQNPD